MYFGCNEVQYATVSADISGMTMLRAYWGSIPTTWPTMPGNKLAMLDLKLSDWGSLYNGAGDKALKSMIATAPPGSMLTAWHECDKNAYTKANPTAAEIALIHEHLFQLTRGTNVKYGSCLTQGAGPLSLAPWVIPGLDFYAIDLYSKPVIPPSLTDRANSALYRAFEQMPGWPNITPVIAECNTSANYQPSEQYQRPDWFREVYSWLLKYNGLAFLTFWNPSGPDSGPWDPTDKAAIYSLNNIASDAPNDVV